LAICIPLCLIVARGAYSLADHSWNQVVQYESPYVAKRVPAELSSSEPPPGPPVVDRLILVIVDGLREDVSRSSMPNLNSLRAKGCDVSLAAPQPTLSYPNWTTILTGASPDISGVTTNWHTTKSLAPTLVDTAKAAGKRVVVVGPPDFTGLFGITQGKGVVLREWDGTFLSQVLIDDALQLSKETSPALVVIHLPDLDETGHQSGGNSEEYRSMAKRIDAELSRIALGMEMTGTVLMVTSDHGHTNAGGHGGWEAEATHVPAVIVGTGVKVGKQTGDLAQIAPTAAALLGVRVPPYAEERGLRGVIASREAEFLASGDAHSVAFDTQYVGVTRGAWVSKDEVTGGAGSRANAAKARDARLAAERQSRLPVIAVVLLAFVLAFVAIGSLSWRALASVGAGVLAYLVIYGFIYFVMHGYRWSLSAFNTEQYVKAFMNWRLLESAFSAMCAVAVATFVYPFLRAEPQGPRSPEYFSGYLALGAATVLGILAVLGLQVGWFLWQWGADVVWTLPDMQAGFKYDLDLVQMTGVGSAVLVAPLVAYAMGRYHPKVM
jgi:hypothetical protein